MILSLLSLVAASIVFPLLAAAVSVALWLAFVPTAQRLSDRLVVSLCGGCGVMVVLLIITAFTSAQLDASTSRILAGLPGVVVLAVLTGRTGFRRTLPTVDGGFFVLGTTTLLATLLTIPTMLARTPESLLGGLFRLGWDNQSHFSIFSSIYEFGGIWEAGQSASRPSFDGYPPLAGGLWTLATHLVYAGRTLPPEELIRPYAYASALTAATSLGVLAWLATRFSDLVMRPHADGARSRAIPTVAGMVVGAGLCFGPALTFFDWGFTNFLLAVALAGAVSWLAVVHFEERPVAGAGLLASGTAAVALLWTPLILVLVPAGVTLLRRLPRHGTALSRGMAAASMVAAALVVLWQSQRIAPDTGVAKDVVTVLGSPGGGLPSLPVSQGLSILVAAAVACLVGSVARTKAWAGALAPCAAALALVFLFFFLALKAATPPQDSYYVAKAGWALTLLAIPLLGILITMVVDAGTRTISVGAAVGRARMGLVVVGVAGIVWSGLTQPTGQVGFLAVPSVATSTMSRWNSFADADEGQRIFHAGTRLASDSTPVLWDGGGLKENRWLASLQGKLDEREFALYQSMRRAPYGPEAVAALRQQLRSAPNMRVSIGYGKKATKSLLDPLVTEFPGRVRLVSLL